MHDDDGVRQGDFSYESLPFAEDHGFASTVRGWYNGTLPRRRVTFVFSMNDDERGTRNYTIVSSQKAPLSLDIHMPTYSHRWFGL